MALSSLLILGLVLIAFGASYYDNSYKALFTLLILLVAPVPLVLGKVSGRNDFGSSRKSSAQEAGLFATSAMATSALILPIFLWHIGSIHEYAAAYAVAGVASIVAALVLYQVFFNIKEESW